MVIRIKPKSYGPVHINVDVDGVISDAETNPLIDRKNISASSPADLALFSLGTCIAMSLSTKAKQLGMKLNAFDLKAVSHKAEDLPSRFGSFEIMVNSCILDDKKQAMELLRKAKPLCTISNTLNAEILLTLADFN